MVLLLEGMNCAGKTTLAQRLYAELGWPIIKFNVPPDDAYDYFRDTLEEARKTHSNLILDRGHLSNLAYNGCLGGGVIHFNQFDALDQSVDVLFLMVDDGRRISL